MENQTELKVEYVDLDKIIPYDKNPRNNSPAVDACAASIRDYGFGQPISVDENMVIISGHTRRLAALKVGMEKIPCIVRRDLTPEQVRAYRVVDNKIAELSEWNEELLAQEIAALPEFNFADYGFDLGALATDMADADSSEDDFDVDAEPEEIRVRRGEIWKLGEHRLMCGDSTSAADIDRLMDGATADLWLTDPPYNVDYHGGDGKTIQNDAMSDEAFREFLNKAFAEAFRVVKQGGSGYIWHSDTEGYNFRKAVTDAGFNLAQCLIWVKDALVLGRQDYHWRHEPCLYVRKPGAAHYFVDDRTQTTVIEQALENIDNMGKEEMRALLTKIYSLKNQTTLFYDKPKKSELHPTAKPIALFMQLVLNSSRPGEIVLDDFGGSGTSVMVCERTKRRCFCMELDERYATVILNRWEEETGQTGERIEEVE